MARAAALDDLADVLGPEPAGRDFVQQPPDDRRVRREARAIVFGGFDAVLAFGAGGGPTTQRSCSGTKSRISLDSPLPLARLIHRKGGLFRVARVRGEFLDLDEQGAEVAVVAHDGDVVGDAGSEVGDRVPDDGHVGGILGLSREALDAADKDLDTREPNRCPDAPQARLVGWCVQAQTANRRQGFGPVANNGLYDGAGVFGVLEILDVHVGRRDLGRGIREDRSWFGGSATSGAQSA